MIQTVPSADAFTAAERELIRREFGLHFGSYPSIADGIFLRTWRSGPHTGQPKLPPAVQSMMARGLVEVRQERLMYRAFFTEAGLVALRQLAGDRRYLDPVRYAHVRQELGLPVESGIAALRPGGVPAGVDDERLG